jgi:hypothetical protein
MGDRAGSNEPTVIERTSIPTGLPYDLATAAFESAIGRLEPETAKALVARQASWAEVEAEMGRMAGPSGLMLFTKFDQGAVASLSGTNTRCAQYLVGNPAIAARIPSSEPASMSLFTSLCSNEKMRAKPFFFMIAPAPFSANLSSPSYAKSALCLTPKSMALPEA